MPSSRSAPQAKPLQLLGCKVSTSRAGGRVHEAGHPLCQTLPWVTKLAAQLRKAMFAASAGGLRRLRASPTTLHSCAACAPFSNGQAHKRGGGTCKAAGQPPKQSPNARCAMQLREHTGKPTKPQHRCSLADKRRTRSQCRWFAGLGLTAAQGVRPDISFPRNVRNVKC